MTTQELGFWYFVAIFGGVFAGIALIVLIAVVRGVCYKVKYATYHAYKRIKHDVQAYLSLFKRP